MPPKYFSRPWLSGPLRSDAILTGGGPAAHSYQITWYLRLSICQRKTSVNRRRSHTPNHCSSGRRVPSNHSETIVSRFERSQQILSGSHYLEIKLLCVPCEPSESILLLGPLYHGLVATDSGRLRRRSRLAVGSAATERGSPFFFYTHLRSRVHWSTCIHCSGFDTTVSTEVA